MGREIRTVVTSGRDNGGGGVMNGRDKKPHRVIEMLYC